jgi:hypothetical protein
MQCSNVLLRHGRVVRSASLLNLIELGDLIRKRRVRCALRCRRCPAAAERLGQAALEVRPCLLRLLLVKRETCLEGLGRVTSGLAGASDQCAVQVG